ncbi:MAG: flagellar basal body rod protein FlgB [Acidobacteriota bacterium]|nr:flagellar basal body rod protein FlgB [Acidobacteriota bacterium]MDQ7087450.1 flagellar basal body rod protein FlgB [Acidobacteriota bacterium]
MRSIDPFFDQMERALDVMTRRQQLLASNVGNVDTPGYRTVDVDFNATLQEAVEQARRQDGGSVETSLRPVEIEGLATRPDGNNVNIDREMAELAATRHRYEVATNVLRNKLRQLRFAIMEGRGA